MLHLPIFYRVAFQVQSRDYIGINEVTLNNIDKAKRQTTTKCSKTQKPYAWYLVNALDNDNPHDQI